MLTMFSWHEGSMERMCDVTDMVVVDYEMRTC